jgi:hypothetical protein
MVEASVLVTLPPITDAILPLMTTDVGESSVDTEDDEGREPAPAMV